MLRYTLYRLTGKERKAIDAFEAMDDGDAFAVAKPTFERLRGDDLELRRNRRIVHRQRKLEGERPH